MAPFIFLLVVFAALSVLPIAHVNAPGLRSARSRLRIALAAMFVLTGSMHFTATESFLQMIPDFLPARREAVFLSGLAELAGAIGLLVPRLRRAAGLGLAAMLVAVFPANVNVAVNNLQIDSITGDPLLQWLRLLLQPVLICLVLWASTWANRVPSMRVAASSA
jgi:uncharacterized membrane protein